MTAREVAMAIGGVVLAVAAVVLALYALSNGWLGAQ